MVGILTVESLLWIAERSCWFHPNWQKGWPALIAVAIAGLTPLFLLFWFVASIIFRWRFQFTSRSLLLLVVLLAIPFSWLSVEMKEATRKAARQQTAIETIRRLGGEITWSHRPSAKCAWLYNLLGNDFFGSPDSLSLEGNVSDGDLELLTTLSELHDFNLCSDQVTDAGLQYVGQLSQLDHLRILAAQITDAGLLHLKGLVRLQQLYLCKTQVTGAGFEYIKGLSRLRLLELSDSQVTDRGLEHLAEMDSLKLVNLPGTRVTDQGIKRLQTKLPLCDIERAQ